MHHPRASGRSGLGDGLGALGLHRVERLRAAGGEDADQVDGDVRIAHRGLDRGRIAQVGLHGMDLADPAERLQVARQFGPAHRDPDAEVALGQRADHVSPQKARSAKDRDEGFRLRSDAMLGPILRVKFGSELAIVSGFVARQHALCLQRNWTALKQFDNRATEPY